MFPQSIGFCLSPAGDLLFRSGSAFSRGELLSGEWEWMCRGMGLPGQASSKHELLNPSSPFPCASSTRFYIGTRKSFLGEARVQTQHTDSVYCSFAHII